MNPLNLSDEAIGEALNKDNFKKTSRRSLFGMLAGLGAIFATGKKLTAESSSSISDIPGSIHGRILCAHVYHAGSFSSVDRKPILSGCGKIHDFITIAAMRCPDCGCLRSATSDYIEYRKNHANETPHIMKHESLALFLGQYIEQDQKRYPEESADIKRKITELLKQA